MTNNDTTHRDIRLAGYDGASQPIYRYADERHLPGYQQATPTPDELAAMNRRRDQRHSDNLFARWQTAEARYCSTPNRVTEADELRCLRAFVSHATECGLSTRGF